MRHDPASAAIVVMLRSLKMYGLAQAASDLIEQGAPAFTAAVPILSQLLKAEVAEREVRSIAYQIKAARFPAYKDLTGFDFASSEVNEAMVRQLHRGEFIDNSDNVVLIGGPGTGKTHIATALGIQAAEHHRKKVRFFSAVDLVNALEQEKALNKAGQLATDTINAATGDVSKALDAVGACESKANSCLKAVVKLGDISPCEETFDTCTSKAISLIGTVTSPLPIPTPSFQPASILQPAAGPSQPR